MTLRSTSTLRIAATDSGCTNSSAAASAWTPPKTSPQDAYVSALDGQARIRNPRAFLAQVARRAAVDQIRRGAVEAFAVAEHLRRESLDGSLDQTDILALSGSCFALPPKLREVFLLSRFVGLTYAEIANRCGVSVDTVKERMTKAQTMCSALMRD